MSKMTTPDTIGVSSALVSFTSIISTIVGIGIPSGIQRFLARALSEDKLSDAKTFMKSAFLLTALAIFICTIALGIFNGIIIRDLGITPILFWISLLLTSSSAISLLLRSIVIASMDTKMLPVIMAISSLTKIGSAAFLVSHGVDALGVMIGFTIFPILSSILLFFVTLKIWKARLSSSVMGLRESITSISRASVANWIPTLISTVGIQLGTIMVYGSTGAFDAGVYFIALSISVAVSSLMTVLLTMAVPALSAMNDGRKQMTWNIVKLSLVVTIPISTVIIVNPVPVLRLLSPEYTSGSLVLQVLLAPLPVIALTSGLNALCYAYGKYKQIILLGLASSVPRTLLYLFLVPTIGSLGAAESYAIGSVIGFAASMISARSLGLNIVWREFTVLSLLPIGIGFATNYICPNVFLSTAVILVASYASFLKLSIVKRRDIEGIGGALPTRLSKPVVAAINRVGKSLNPSY